MASTATATRALYESLSAIGATWPKDRLRPDVSFGQSLIRAAERSLTASPPSGPPPPQTASSQGVTTRIDTKALDYRPLEQEETRMVEIAIKALSDIKSGQASKQYPMPESLARPVTNPEYYVRLGRILESAARGEKMNLSWTQRVRHFFGMKI